MYLAAIEAESHLIVEAIWLVNGAANTVPSAGLHTHSTRSMAASWAIWTGVYVHDSGNQGITLPVSITWTPVACSVLSTSQWDSPLTESAGSPAV